MNVTMTRRTPQAIRCQQVRKLLGELCLSVQRTREAIDRLEQLAGDEDSLVDPTASFTWGEFGRELAFLDTACLHVYCTTEADFTPIVEHAMARRA